MDALRYDPVGLDRLANNKTDRQLLGKPSPFFFSRTIQHLRIIFRNVITLANQSRIDNNRRQHNYIHQVDSSHPKKDPSKFQVLNRISPFEKKIC